MQNHKDIKSALLAALNGAGEQKIIAVVPVGVYWYELRLYSLAGHDLLLRGQIGVRPAMLKSAIGLTMAGLHDPVYMYDRATGTARRVDDLNLLRSEAIERMQAHLQIATPAGK